MKLRQLFLNEAPTREMPQGSLQTSSGWASELFGGINTVMNKPWELDQPESNTGNGGTASTAGTGAATNSPTGAGASGNARTAMNFFTQRGLTTPQAAGLVGNLQAESGANLNPAAVGDGGRAMGIAQWHPDRRANFQRAIGKPFERSTFEDQLRFIWWEFNNTERNAYSRLRRARTAEEAAAIVDQYYERSSGAHRQRRIAYARALMPASTGTATA